MRSALRLLLLLPAAALALDLNPQASFKMLEGVKISSLQFKDGPGRVLWRPPADWRMSYEQERLIFIPKDKTHASLELRVIDRAANDRDFAASAAKVAEYAALFLPKVATEIVLKGTNPGPFTINGLAATEFLLDFQEPGHPSKASFSVVDLNERERLLVIISAQPKDFAELRDLGIQCMFSWEKEE